MGTEHWQRDRGVVAVPVIERERDERLVVSAPQPVRNLVERQGGEALGPHHAKGMVEQVRGHGEVGVEGRRSGRGRPMQHEDHAATRQPRTQQAVGADRLYRMQQSFSASHGYSPNTAKSRTMTTIATTNPPVITTMRR